MAKNLFRLYSYSLTPTLMLPNLQLLSLFVPQTRTAEEIQDGTCAVRRGNVGLSCFLTPLGHSDTVPQISDVSPWFIKVSNFLCNNLITERYFSIFFKMQFFKICFKWLREIQRDFPDDSYLVLQFSSYRLKKSSEFYFKT